MKDIYFTLVQIDNLEPLKTGGIVLLQKEIDNHYDDEAIAVFNSSDYDFIAPEGKKKSKLKDYINYHKAYVANSVRTVARGTYSGGRLYDKFDNVAKAEIMFILHNKAICKLLGEVKDKSDLKN